MSRPNSLFAPTCFCGVSMVICLGLSLLLTPGCKGKKPSPSTPAAARTCTVYTTFYPTTYFVERIGGNKVKVVCPCPADADPAFWMPDEKTIQAYQTADLVVVNGASFEKWLEKVALPESRLVDTAKPFAEEFIILADAVMHSHGPAGEHTHEGVDGHTWLDPINAKIQAQEIKKALVKRLPVHKKVFEEGYAALARDLDTLDARFKALTGKMGERQLLCSHPAYNYLARRYDWRLESFHLDPDTMPDDATFDRIKLFLEGQPARYMLWESQPTEEIAKKFRESFKVESIVFSPCEGLDSEELGRGEDFLSVMNCNVDRLEKAFGM